MIKTLLKSFVYNVFGKEYSQSDKKDLESTAEELFPSKEEKDKSAINNWVQTQVDRMTAEKAANRAEYLKRCLENPESIKSLVSKSCVSYMLVGMDNDSVEFILNFIDAMMDKFVTDAKTTLGLEFETPAQEDVLMTHTMFRTFMYDATIMENIKRVSGAKSLDVIMKYRVSKTSKPNKYEIWYTISVYAIIDASTNKNRFVAMF